ncbi:MFS transporter [Mechercharimyces sp. CAU 1602]|uniref:MFS transporter n=1 Tax=Mechercharimyces sp. CAU 1602 TaxID=2973933 RepID=UPI002162F185|nr:MFS transporter [Mechercharimyces sp. CAU 1602]MCS1350769.1 MFS transporter [Mechercharimyces sp. CAU 1602]
MKKKDRQASPQVSVLIVLSWIPLLMVLGNSMIIPVLPQIEENLHLSSFQVSLIITLFSLAAGLIIPFCGIFSDRIGRKKVIMSGLIVYAIGGIIAGGSALIGGGSYPFLLIGRIVQGIGAAGTAPIAMALVSDLYAANQRSKALGAIEAANGMGKVLSPILGSLIGLISWYALFFAFPLLIFPALLAMWFIVKEPRSQEPAPPLSQYRAHLKKTWVRQGKWMSVAFLAGAITLFILFGVLFYLSNLLEKRYGVEGIVKGLILAIPLLALSGSSYWTGVHIQKHAHHMKGFIVTGLTLSAFVMIAVPFVQSTYLLIALLLLNGVGGGVVLPCLNTMITSSVHSAERGIVTSLYNSVRFLGVASGPPVFSALSGSPMILFLGSGAISLLTAILTLLFVHPPHRLISPHGHKRILIRKPGFQSH